MTTERTVWVTHDAEPGACTEPECDGFGRVSERQVSVPWCTEHDAPRKHKATWDEAAGLPMCDEILWTTEDDGHLCVIEDGVVWKVLE